MSGLFKLRGQDSFTYKQAIDKAAKTRHARRASVVYAKR